MQKRRYMRRVGQFSFPRFVKPQNRAIPDYSKHIDRNGKKPPSDYSEDIDPAMQSLAQKVPEDLKNVQTGPITISSCESLAKPINERKI